MIYLALAILSTVSFNIGFTYVNAKKLNTLNVTFYNYLAATVISFVLMLFPSQTAAVQSFSLTAMLQNIKGELSESGSFTFAVVLGVITGVAYLVALLVNQRSIAKNGPSPTTVFSRSGIIVPIILSIFIWNEIPTPLKLIGMVIALISLALFNYDGGFKLNPVLIFVFLASGACELTSKMFSAWCLESYKPLFLLICFFICTLICTFLVLKQDHKITMKPKETLLGIGLGAINIASAFFMLKALAVLPSIVVFPSHCAGVILLIALIGKLFFSENLGKKGIVAIFMTAISLVLINL